MDRIVVQRIALFAHHGVFPEEAKLGQRFYVTVDARLDLSEAGKMDKLSASVSYAALTAIVERTSGIRRFSLLEALAEAIAAEILAAYPRIHTVIVRIDKPSAPVPALIDGVTIEIERKRGG